MPIELFFVRYHALTVAERNQVISTKTLGLTTWNDMFDELKRLEGRIEPLRVKEAELLKLVARVVYQWE